ncbi:MAG: polysaccharide biosynthesis tyrosine autokinase [Tepidisphaeraceae bacterium]
MAVDFSSRNSSDSAPARQESIVEILWRRKQLVVIVFLLCVMSAAILLKVTPKRFTAEARVYVSRNLPKNVDPATADLPTFLNTQSELIKSATVTSLAMGAPGMYELAYFSNADNPTAYLKDKLDVQPQPSTSILNIRLAGTNRDEITQITDAIAKAYVASVADQKRNVNFDNYTNISNERRQLDDQRSDARKLLANLQAETASYLTPGDSTGTLAFEKLRKLSSNLTNAQLESVRLKGDFEDALKAVGMKPDAIDQGKLDNATVVSLDSLPVLKGNLASLSQQLIEAKRQYVPSHPYVRTIQRQIKDIQFAQAALLQKALVSAAKKEAEATDLYKSQEEVTRNINAKAAELAMITDRVKSLDIQIADKDAKIQQIQVSDNVGIDAKQIDDAAIDENSGIPESKKTLALAAVIGLVLGMLTALVREWVSPSLGSAHRIADTVGVPLLGTLPRVAGFSSNQLAMLSYDSADTEAAEAFRSVRTSLLFGAEHCQTIAITSPATGDGKTTLAANLATLLAQSGKRVVLIDADFRQPSLHAVFGTDNPIGLSGVLGGEDLDSAVRRTQVEHLDILTAGPASGDVSQQLNSPRFTEVLRQLKQRYDHVLFDTAGVVGSNDARVIAAGCDTTLLVMRDERTTRFAATTARDALLSVGAMLMGIVLNDAVRGPAYPAGVERRERSQLLNKPPAPGLACGGRAIGLPRSDLS